MPRLRHSLRNRAFQNAEIGRVFGTSYSAVSPIVKDVKERMKKAPQLARKAQSINL